MKYYSEKTKQLFDTPEKLKEAERNFDSQELQRKHEEMMKEAKENHFKEIRKQRAKEVEDAYLDYLKTREKAYYEVAEKESKWTELRDKFAKDYHGYHMTYVNNNGVKHISFGDLMHSLFEI